MDIELQSIGIQQSRRNTYPPRGVVKAGHPPLTLPILPSYIPSALTSFDVQPSPKLHGDSPTIPQTPTKIPAPEASQKSTDRPRAMAVHFEDTVMDETIKPPPPPFPPPDQHADPIHIPGPLPNDLPPPPPPPGPPLPLDLAYPDMDGNPRLNAAAHKIYIRFMEELSAFVLLQENITRLRVQVQEKRTALRIFRDRVSDCDREFMDGLRKFWTNGTPNDPRLEKLYESSITARDVVGPAEVDYEEMEVRLGGAEFSLKEKFEELQRKFQHFFRLQAGTTTVPSHHSDISFESSASSMERNDPRNASMLQGAYLGDNVKVGERPAPVPIPPAQDSASGPHESSISHTNKRRSTILTAEDQHNTNADDVYFPLDFAAPDLKSSNMWSASHTLHESLRGVGELYTIPEDMLIPTPERDILAEGCDLLLLGDDSDTQSTLSDYLLEFDSTRDRVNQWLLHKLRISPWEVFELHGRIVKCSADVPSWARLALKFWRQDFPGVYPEASIDSEEQESIGHQSNHSPVPSPYPELVASRKRQKRGPPSRSSDPASPLSRNDFEIRFSDSAARRASFTGNAPPMSLSSPYPRQ
ncbi:hypothetical protein K432DRAFT_388460 [Lepidopterella palustris CBS 459.81]|uniref:Uncharacterized protein n=1 Tax=Lepidopterella palustris CBS 459.81 TaxID=1314670 RepID=A0A8E2EKF3_9PEZI|nr:hypothetical protein K432DRAFT_388460 [Lepidopterella palustris CBS 459.81]